MFSIELRTKEIGIYLVHGANIGSIIWMLTKESFYQILISLSLAVPAGYLIVNKLFSRTAYHTDISFMTFLLAILIVMCVAICAVGFQAYRLASKNPVETLKCE